MSNLGRYEEIVKQAKDAGGVDALIRVLEEAAIRERAPQIFGKGLAAGALLVSGLVGGVKLVASRKRARHEVQNARADLRSALQEPSPAQGAASAASPGMPEHTEPSGPRDPAPQEPRAQPVAGGDDDGPPAQGEGAPDSY